MFHLAMGRFLTIFCAYAPTLTLYESSKYTFYQLLHSNLQSVSRNDKLLVMGDFNGRVAKHQVNSNVLRLLSTWEQYDLFITMIQPKQLLQD